LPSSSFGLESFTPGESTKPWVGAMSASAEMIRIGSFWPLNTICVKAPPTPIYWLPPAITVSVSAADWFQ
jgi:hypothetical protein